MKRLIFIAALLAATVAWSQSTYVLILRNGSRIVAREKYVVKGPSAEVMLKSGTLISIPLDQIDVKATEAFNARHLGDVVVVDEGGEEEVLPTPTPTPSLARLGSVRSGVAGPVGSAALPTPTPGISFRGEPFSDQQVVKAFEEALDRNHLYLYRTSRGTRPGYLYVEVQVNGQPDVLKALQAVCSTYHILADTAADRAPERVELRLLNEAGREAGLFRMSRDDAAELATGKVTAEEFFVSHVLF